jgi:hypothetical protein
VVEEADGPKFFNHDTKDLNGGLPCVPQEMARRECAYADARGRGDVDRKSRGGGGGEVGQRPRAF